MQITPPLLPHLAYYEALAALDESDVAWAPTVAGLLTLRLFDTWSEMVRRGERVQAWEVSGVAEAVEQLPPLHPVRATLARIVEAAGEGADAPAYLLPELMAYARTLRFEARWLLAADVFATVLANAAGGEPELLITAAYHRGYCLRMAGQYDAAAASYDEGRLLAASCGNEAGMLEAEVSHAMLALSRGNLPLAESMLDAVIAQANPVSCRRVLARAYQDRAAVAVRRNRPEEAVVFGYRALPLFDTAADRDRVLGDVAAALGMAGHHEAAWDAHLVLAATAQEQETRWVAGVNLIELAAWRGNAELFERFRADLAGQTLPPWLAGYYHLHVAEGAHRFGDCATAAAELRRTVEVAAQYGFNEVRVKAEDLLTSINRAPTAVAAAAAPGSDGVAEVIEAVRVMREMAEATA